MLGRQVAGRNYPPTNKNTLIRTLEEWDKLPQQLLIMLCKTHKDPVGTALHIQEANMPVDPTQNALQPLHDYREMIEEREGFQRHRLLYLTLKTT
ncbi:hypothetical protein TNCV_1398271 [Trichonephila clavipes]|nr:hypothetical protein TNCV_1398271 [Trichonephila clavipes]